MTDSLPIRPELVAPAGDRECLRAAVANGADAVYFGLPGFNARQRATNFTREELPEVIGYLHDHNVRGYITFNTLIFSEELSAAMEWLEAIAAAGADAVVVQDVGLVPLIRRMAPTLRVHASTQMTLTEPLGIAMVGDLGVRRVILARELSLAEIEQIIRATGAEVEVFVHGALCISYSGQCLASEALGGRSANRGLCAQPCRMEYQLIQDGRPRDLGDRSRLLSPLDLATYDRIEPLVRVGVAAFKIEGRLKSASYVAAVTGVYREAIDAAVAGRPFTLSAERRTELEQGFSRGFTSGYLGGESHPPIVDGRSHRNRGVRVGAVARTDATRIIVLLDEGAGLSAGDGVVFEPAKPGKDEQGGRVFKVEPVGSARRATREVALTFREQDVKPSAVEAGSVIWKTDDPALRRKLDQTYARDAVVRRSPLSLTVDAPLGGQLRVNLTDTDGRRAEAAWDRPLERAEKHPLTLELIREQFGRLGDSPYELASVHVERLDPVMAPKSVLNDLRRRMVESLLAARRAQARHAVVEANPLARVRAEIGAAAGKLAELAPQLHVLVRTMAQLEAAVDGARRARGAFGLIYCDFRDPAALVEAVQTGRAEGVDIGAVAPRILKPGQEERLRALLEAAPQAMLVRNLGTLAYCRRAAPEMPLIGDFALNVANEASAALLMEHGFARLTPSYDLNYIQLAALFRRARADWFELVIHQHVPMFHVQHCLYAAHLREDGAGHTASGCSAPCRRHQLALQDRVGAAHPVLPDALCRNTVFNARAQSGCECAAEAIATGVRHFRVELLREGARRAGELLDLYAGLLNGTEDGAAVWRKLQGMTDHGMTRGTFANE